MVREVSDHCAIVVKEKVLDWGPKPFKLFDVWQNEQGFKQVVKSVWDKRESTGCRLETLKDKLKGLKTELKKWTREKCYKDKNRKLEVIQEIERLDQKDEDSGLEEVLRKRRVELLSVLNELNEKEMMILRQKYRVDWIVKGDRNSRYFHSRIRWRWKTNELNGLMFDGQWIDEPNLVKCCVKRFMEEKFAAKQEMGWSLNGVQFKSSVDQN